MSGWIGPFGNWEEGNTTHLWKEYGTFNIKVKAKDIKGSESDWSDILIVNVESNYYPSEPAVNGPVESIAGHWITFSVRSIDNFNDQIRYVFDGGEEYIVWTDYNESGEIVNISYRWGETWYDIVDERVFTLMIRGQDIHGAFGPWYVQDITIFNHPPEKPIIDGPLTGNQSEKIIFKLISWDVDDHRLKFIYNIYSWNDLEHPLLSGGTIAYDCNETCNFSYYFSDHGNYMLKIQCKDVYGAYGPWSYHNTTIKKKSRDYQIDNFVLLFIEKFLEKFPILKEVLSWLI